MAISREWARTIHHDIIGATLELSMEEVEEWRVES
jgi:hypothetical protein